MKLNIFKKIAFLLTSFFAVNAYAEDLLETGFKKTYPVFSFFLTAPGVVVFLIGAIVVATLSIKIKDLLLSWIRNFALKNEGL